MIHKSLLVASKSASKVGIHAKPASSLSKLLTIGFPGNLAWSGNPYEFFLVFVYDLFLKETIRRGWKILVQEKLMK